MVGRVDELAAVTAMLRSQMGSAVLVGEPGVGKTRLAAEIASRHARTGGSVERILVTAAASRIPLGALGDLVPDIVRRGDDRLAVTRRTAAALAARHAHRPLLLIDDAHLLDDASAALVRSVVHRTGVQVLATMRLGVTAPEPMSALLGELGAARIELGSLGVEAIEALATALLGAPIAPGSRNWILRRSGGNPLYLKELLGAVRTPVGVVTAAGSWFQRWPGAAARLDELIETRIAALPEAERRALELVALAEPLERRQITQLAEPSVIEALEMRGLLVTTHDVPAAVRTVHPSYAEVISARLDSGALRSRHAELAGVLGRRLPGRRMLVALWMLEDRADLDVELLRAAARDALAAGEPRLAVRFARAALTVAPHLEVALTLASALRRIGSFSEAEAVLGAYEIEARTTPYAWDYLSSRVMGLHFGLGRSTEALALLHSALAWSDRAAWRSEVRCLTATVCCTSGRVSDGVELASALLEAPVISPQVRLIAGLLLGLCLPLLGRPRDGIAALRWARELAGPDAALQWPETAALTSAEICSGDGWREAVARLQAAHAQAVAGGNERLATGIEIGLMDLAAAQGNMRETRRWAESALERLTRSDPFGLAPLCLAEVARSAAHTGELDVATAALASIRDFAEQRPLPPHISFRVSVAQATLTAAEGHAEAAQLQALELAGHAGLEAPLPLQEAAALHLYIRLGGAPATVVDRLTEIAARADGPTLADLWAEHARAGAARDDAALEAVADRYEEIGARLWAAEALAQAASVSPSAPRAAMTVRARERSAVLAAGCRVLSTPLLRDDLLAGLSPRERQIGRLIARGHSNSDIAAALALSVRTVEAHIYRASLKLGVRHRGEFGSWVAERTQGLVAARLPDPTVE